MQKLFLKKQTVQQRPKYYGRLKKQRYSDHTYLGPMPKEIGSMELDNILLGTQVKNIFNSVNKIKPLKMNAFISKFLKFINKSYTSNCYATSTSVHPNSKYL